MRPAGLQPAGEEPALPARGCPCPGSRRRRPAKPGWRSGAATE